MKKLYPSGRAMPTRTGPSEPTRSSHAASSERMTTSPKSLLRVRSISPFYSYRRRAMVGSPPATSNLYDVLKRVDWLAIFSPWAIINRSKMYAMTTKQNTSATRTPANKAALKALAIAKPAPICRRGGITVVPKIFSGEFFGSFFGVKKERPVAASDGKPMRGGNKGLSVQSEDANRLQRLKTFHTSSSSTLYLLSTIFVLLNFGFISATHAQSQTLNSGGGAAEVVVMGEVRSAGDGRMMEGVTIRIKEARTLTDERGSFRIETDLQEGEIEASFVGYRSAIVSFDLNSRFVRIKLDPAYETIDEVEVVSTGYQRLP